MCQGGNHTPTPEGRASNVLHTLTPKGRESYVGPALPDREGTATGRGGPKLSPDRAWRVCPAPPTPEGGTATGPGRGCRSSSPSVPGPRLRQVSSAIHADPGGMGERRGGLIPVQWRLLIPVLWSFPAWQGMKLSKACKGTKPGINSYPFLTTSGFWNTTRQSMNCAEFAAD